MTIKSTIVKKKIVTATRGKWQITLICHQVGYQSSEMMQLLLISLHLFRNLKGKAEKRIKQFSLSPFLCIAGASSPRLLLVRHNSQLVLGTSHSCPDLQGVLVVMLVFTVLELLLAAYSSVFWWKQLYSNNPGVSMLTCCMIPALSQVQATIIQAQK